MIVTRRLNDVMARFTCTAWSGEKPFACSVCKIAWLQGNDKWHFHCLLAWCLYRDTAVFLVFYVAFQYFSMLCFNLFSMLRFNFFVCCISIFFDVMFQFFLYVAFQFFFNLSFQFVLFSLSGEYLVSVKFNGQHIPDSPFKVYMLPSGGDSKKLNIQNLQQRGLQASVYLLWHSIYLLWHSIYLSWHSIYHQNHQSLLCQITYRGLSPEWPSCLTQTSLQSNTYEYS